MLGDRSTDPLPSGINFASANIDSWGAGVHGCMGEQHKRLVSCARVTLPLAKFLPSTDWQEGAVSKMAVSFVHKNAANLLHTWPRAVALRHSNFQFWAAPSSRA